MLEDPVRPIYSASAGKVMKTAEFHQWLREEYLQRNGKRFAVRTPDSRRSEYTAVEQAEGNLDEEFERDNLSSMLERLHFTGEDQEQGRSPKHHIRIDGDPVRGSATYRTAVNLHRKFCAALQSQPMQPLDSLAEEQIIRDLAQEELTATERQAIIQSRVGQGRFRYLVLEIWDYRCAVTGASTLLCASHIKPWRHSINRERLDGYNGLSLSPTFDRSFDLGLITFELNGKIRISRRLPERDARLLGISSTAQILGILPTHAPYLEYHQRHIWQRD